jgi:hypothetical protein
MSDNVILEIKPNSLFCLKQKHISLKYLVNSEIFQMSRPSLNCSGAVAVVVKSSRLLITKCLE